MTNVATIHRDAGLRRNIEDGLIIVWADGFGVWHARVAATYANPINVARLAIRLQLQDRAPRDTYVNTPAVTYTPEDDTNTHFAYKEV